MITKNLTDWRSSILLRHRHQLLPLYSSEGGRGGGGYYNRSPSDHKLNYLLPLIYIYTFLYKTPQSLARPYKCSVFPPWFCLNSDDNEALGRRQAKTSHRIHWLQRTQSVSPDSQLRKLEAGSRSLKLFVSSVLPSATERRGASLGVGLPKLLSGYYWYLEKYF